MANYEELKDNKESFEKAISKVNHVASRLIKMGEAYSLLGQRESAFVCYELQAFLDEATVGLQSSFEAGEAFYLEEFKSATAASTQQIFDFINHSSVQNGGQPIFTKEKI